LGPAYGQIAEGYAESLPVPDVPVAIFAGDAAGLAGDGLLTVDETRLGGLGEHHVVPAVHTFVMNEPFVIQRAVSFLAGAPN
jgi:hypothetical protein